MHITTFTPHFKGKRRCISGIIALLSVLKNALMRNRGCIGRYLDIALWLGRYHDIALTTTAFDAEAATKHQFPLIIYIEMLKVLHCGFELELLKVLHRGFELNMLI